MLSILIPAYNFDVVDLAEELLRQAKQIDTPIEVLIIDDHSLSYFRKRNASLASRSRVSYLELDYNIGRSKIRNRLVDFASGEWLLFLDCDMVISRPDFLQNYISRLGEAPVICGGIGYGIRPMSSEYILRWKYGIVRESKPALRRQMFPHWSFLSGNFMISREVYNQIRFNEEISGYGHEDTLFGLELKHRNIPVLHIDNQAIHIGLEPCYEYLAKSEQGIVNLIKLLQIAPDMKPELQRAVRLLRVSRFMNFFRLNKPLSWVFMIFNPIIRRHLCSKRPSLILLDIYKLGLAARLFKG